MTVLTKRAIATLKFPTTIPELILFIRGVISKLTANVYVPGPYPAGITPFANLTTNVGILESAQTAVQTRVSGSKVIRDAARDVCKKDIRSIRGMVQQLADNNTSATITASVIIESAGFGVKTTGARKTTVFDALNTKVSAKVKLVAPPIPKGRGSHSWSYTADAVGFTGKVILPITTKANITVEGLVIGTKYAFFHTAVSPTGASTEDGPVFLTVI